MYLPSKLRPPRKAAATLSLAGEHLFLTRTRAILIILLEYCSALLFASECLAFAPLISLPTMGPCGLVAIGRLEALEQKETCIWLTSNFLKASPGFVARC
jgi:hypothetical protein